MRFRALALISFVGCATVPPPRVPIDDVVKRESALPLDEAMTRFQQSARTTRASVIAGAPMPSAHARAWTELLDASAAADPDTMEAAKLRLVLETELTTDSQLFGDIPVEVANRVPPLISRLSEQLSDAAVRAAPVDPRRFCWPVDPLVVSSPYGERMHPIAAESRFHAGVDLEAPLRQPVRAASSGLVIFSGWNGAHGQQVELMHDPHWSTRYSHLDKLLVKSGTEVKRGQIIGLAGDTGLATGPHVHFELRRDGDALDPELFIPQRGQPLVSERP